jgi:hypothetical protein
MSLINQTRKILESPRIRDKKKDTFCKACTKCLEVLPFSEYYDDARGKYGKEARCKACKYIYQRSWRIANPEKYRELFRKVSPNRAENQRRSRTTPHGRKAHGAREKLRYHMKTGKIKKRNICEICYTSPTQCHHSDYDKALEFVELCTVCHKFLHNKSHYLTKQNG